MYTYKEHFFKKNFFFNYSKECCNNHKNKIFSQNPCGQRDQP